jgi:hypothetical protein
MTFFFTFFLCLEKFWMTSTPEKVKYLFQGILHGRPALQVD